MYKGRNPSPPEDYEDFDYLSSANRRVLFLKPTRGVPHKPLPPLNIFKEALMRSKLVARVLSKKNSESKPIFQSPEVKNDIQEKAFEDSEENSMDHLLSPSFEPVEKCEIPVIVSHCRPETKMLPEIKIKKEIDTQKLMSDMSLSEVCQEDEFSKALSKDIELRSKLHDRKEEFMGPEFPKHGSRRNREDEYLSDSPRNKIHERKEDSSEYRKPKSLRRKRDEDYLGEHDYRRCKSRSSRSRQGNYSSDESEYSHRSYRSHKRSKSKDSVISRKRSDRKSSRRHSDSDSDGSIKVISSKTRRETTSKTKKGIVDEDSDKELYSKKVIKSEEKEKPKKKADSPDQLKLSPKSVQHDPVMNEDPYLDEDVEITAGVFGGSETYYCKVCQLNLNGIACYETHMNGKKHKKALNAQLLRPEALLYQVIGNHSKDPSFMQALNRNVKMTKSNERAKFQTMIEMYHENPLPGLNYIDEIHAKDGINYYCELCEAPCMPASILPHLLGFKHYMNFMKIIEPSYYDRNKDRPKKDIERQVKNKLREHERKFGRKEMTVVKCQVDSKGFPTDDPGPSIRMPPYREEDFKVNTSAFVDDYGDFYCKICDAHMNNESMFHAHMVGKRHLKNEKKFSAGLGTSLSSSGKTRAPPHVPSELEIMLNDVHDTPVVGLNFMRETQNPNGEYYTCFICGCCATSDVVEHIISMKHRIKFLETVNENKSIPNSIGSIRELEVSTQIREGLVADVCREIEGRFGRGKVEVYI